MCSIVDSLMVFLKELYENFNFENKNKQTKKSEKSSSMHRVQDALAAIQYDLVCSPCKQLSCTDLCVKYHFIMSLVSDIMHLSCSSFNTLRLLRMLFFLLYSITQDFSSFLYNFQQMMFYYYYFIFGAY